MSVVATLLKWFGFGALSRDANDVPIQAATGHTFEDASVPPIVSGASPGILTDPVQLNIPVNAISFRIGPTGAGGLRVGNNQYLDSAGAGRGAETLAQGDSAVYYCSNRDKQWWIRGDSAATKINLTFMY